ncbi:unnamed protein product [Fusarium graminearum]|uniref:Uncharacterized protein n=1 Tax=Gibberella zeae TaxID=5518 RepID=A0A8H3Q8V1_GIBZA|nr:unnamed protein product [Fusarium graminearum]CAG1967834.1 unnamed protein product [Fusarium graminearum]CAG1976886.1 unnamed protein product [Fusarium graminearum]CAG2009119.1 unnamed protein product [Fusarium graminearum]
MTTHQEIVRTITDSEWGIKVLKQLDTQPDTGSILRETLFETWYLFSHLENDTITSRAKPVTLINGACPDRDTFSSETNCTQICTNPDTLFASWKTLWQCLSLAVLTIGNATFSNSLKRPPGEFGALSPSVQINDALWEYGILYDSDFDGRSVLDLTYRCASASCREMTMGECSIGQLDSGFFQSEKLEWIKMSKALESLCYGLESDINIDIAGPGILITYITQTAMAVFAWAFFLVLAVSDSIQNSTSILGCVFRKKNMDHRSSVLGFLGRTNIAHATSTFLAELHEAQCFFVAAIEIALINANSRPAIFTGADNWQSLLWNRDSIRFLAGMGVWPIILAQISLRRAQLDSMYYLLLSTIAVILAGVAADTASKPDPDNVYRMFADLNNLEECGGNPSLRTFCVEERSSMYWFVFPADSIYAFIALLAIIWWIKLWNVIVSSSWFIQRQKPLSNEQHEDWERLKRISFKFSLVLIHAAEAGALACICLGLLGIRRPLLDLLLRGESGTWSVGQLVAVLIWVPVISKYAHLVIQEQKPTLTEKDLKFDFDYSQIRDPRRTPGRVKRPSYEERELSEEWLSNFHIPNHKSPHTDPLHTFYDLHKCHKKGPNGSPTYDSAGFQLDYKKVADWMKPRQYSKKTMMNSMDRSLKRGVEEKQLAYETFFVDGKGPEADSLSVMDLIKDQMSKDLNVPYHQIDAKEIKNWGKKGFEKVKADEWWSKPNEVERARFSTMHRGAALRKKL